MSIKSNELCDVERTGILSGLKKSVKFSTIDVVGVMKQRWMIILTKFLISKREWNEMK